MQVWKINVLHTARWKYRTQKWSHKSPFAHHHTTLSRCIFATKACIDNRKKLIKQQYVLRMSSQYGELRSINSWDLLAPQQISTGFASCLRFCSDVAHWRQTKLCTMFGHLLRCYTIYTFQITGLSRGKVTVPTHPVKWQFQHTR